MNTQGCHIQGKLRKQDYFFKVREMTGNFASSQGNSYFHLRVSEKAGNFIVLLVVRFDDDCFC